MSIRRLSDDNNLNIKCQDLEISGTNNITLESLADTNITNPGTGNVLTYSNNSWINLPASGGAVSMNDLTDVNAPTPSENSVLYRNNSNEYVSTSAGTTLGDVLTSQGAGLPVTWVSARDNQNLGDHYNAFFSAYEKGQLISRNTANDTWETVNIGNEADLLGVSASGVVRWIDVRTRNEELLNKTIDRTNNNLINVFNQLLVNRVQRFKSVIANMVNGSYIDGSPVSTNDKVLIIGQDNSNPTFSKVGNGLYLVNAIAPPTRLDTGLNSSTQQYYCDGGSQYAESLWRCKQALGSDVCEVDELDFIRLDVQSKLYGSIYQSLPYSLTLPAIANTYAQFRAVTTGGPTSGDVTQDTLNRVITVPIRATTTYEISFNVSWNSTSMGNKSYTFAVHWDDGGGIQECVASKSSRALPTNDLGITSGSCLHIVNAGTSVTFSLQVKSDTASVNLTSVSGHFRVKEIS